MAANAGDKDMNTVTANANDVDNDMEAATSEGLHIHAMYRIEEGRVRLVEGDSVLGEVVESGEQEEPLVDAVEEPTRAPSGAKGPKKSEHGEGESGKKTVIRDLTMDEGAGGLWG